MFDFIMKVLRLVDSNKEEIEDGLDTINKLLQIYLKLKQQTFGYENTSGEGYAIASVILDHAEFLPPTFGAGSEENKPETVEAVPVWVLPLVEIALKRLLSKLFK